MAPIVYWQISDSRIYLLYKKSKTELEMISICYVGVIRWCSIIMCDTCAKTPADCIERLKKDGDMTNHIIPFKHMRNCIACIGVDNDRTATITNLLKQESIDMKTFFKFINMNHLMDMDEFLTGIPVGLKFIPLTGILAYSITKISELFNDNSSINMVNVLTRSRNIQEQKISSYLSSNDTFKVRVE